MDAQEAGLVMQLSPHFTLEEFTRSAAARDLGDANQPTEAHLANLKYLAERLEEVRALFNLPVTIESAYRNPAVNAAVNGVPGSDHAQGLAADIQIDPLSDLEVATRIRDSGIKFDQLIREDGRTVHISFSPRMRQQVLRQPGGPGSMVYAGLA